VGVDRRERIEAAVKAIAALRFDGLVTLERAVMVAERTETMHVSWEGQAATKLTVYVGRHERLGGVPAYEAVVDLLHRRGIAGATVLLGVDGTIDGVRRRARFFAANTDVPLLVVAVGSAQRVAAAIDALDDPIFTLERVSKGPVGTPWEKLTLYSSEPTGAHLRLVRALRKGGAAGATCLRGIWGYSDASAPHGDRLFALRRRVPVVTTVVDEAARIERYHRIASGSGLLIREGVPFASMRQKGKRGLGIE
jgi:PII-like signaling protein